MNAYIWRESVYKNDFKCMKCSKKLFNPVTGKLIANRTAVDTDPIYGEKYLFCKKCNEVVAKIQEDIQIQIPEAQSNILQGRYEDHLNKKAFELANDMVANKTKKEVENITKHAEKMVEKVKDYERMVNMIKADCEKKLSMKDKQIQELTKELDAAEAKMRKMEKQLLGRNGEDKE